MSAFSTVPRERLTAGIEHGAPHWRPIWCAVRDDGVGFGLVTQRAGRFDAPKGKPTILVLGDDLHEAFGPEAFHAKSLRRYVSDCAAAVVVSGSPEVVLYAAAATVPAVWRRNVVLVETRLSHEQAWLDCLRGINPRLRMLVGTVKPETEARH